MMVAGATILILDGSEAPPQKLLCLIGASCSLVFSHLDLGVLSSQAREPWAPQSLSQWVCLKTEHLVTQWLEKNGHFGVPPYFVRKPIGKYFPAHSRNF